MTIDKYETAKVGVSRSLGDAEEIERRAREAGIQLIKTQEELDLLKDEAEHYSEAKEKDQQMLMEIQQVCRAR